jgi:hypothetical protein
LGGHEGSLSILFKRQDQRGQDSDGALSLHEGAVSRAE